MIQQMVERVEQLPEASQEAVVKRILAELDDEARWDESFAKSQDLLAAMADEALAEYHAGKTRTLCFQLLKQDANAAGRE